MTDAARYLDKFTGESWMLPIRDAFLKSANHIPHASIFYYPVLYSVCYHRCDVTQFARFLDRTIENRKQHVSCHLSHFKRLLINMYMPRDFRNIKLALNDLLVLTEKDYFELNDSEFLRVTPAIGMFILVGASKLKSEKEIQLHAFCDLFSTYNGYETPIDLEPFLEDVFEVYLDAFRYEHISYDETWLLEASLETNIGRCNDIINYMWNISEYSIRLKLIEYYYKIRHLPFIERLFDMQHKIKLNYFSCREHQQVNNAIEIIKGMEEYDEAAEYLPLPVMILEKFLSEETRIRKLYTESLLTS